MRRVRDVVLRRRRQRLIREQRRHQHDAVQLDAVAHLKFLRQARRADRAVALPDEELRRRPPIVGLEISVDELAERAQIAADAVELRVADAGDRTAVAGVDRIDVDHVGAVEQRILVVDQMVRRRRLEPFVRHLHLARRERSHVQPDRGRAGPAVVEERDRPRLRVLSVFRVRDKKHSRRHLAVVEAYRQRSGRRRVLDVAAVEADAVLGLRDLLLGGSGHLVPRRGFNL